MPYKPPKILGRTLHILRKEAQLSQAALGEMFGVNNSAISSLETRTNQVSYQMLDYYHMALGVPNGIILSISHVAALIRDINAHPDGSRRALEKKKLLWLALYLRNLSDHLIEISEGNGKASLKPAVNNFGHIERDNKKSWDPLIVELCRVTQTGFNPKQNTPFANPERLAHSIEK